MVAPVSHLQRPREAQLAVNVAAVSLEDVRNARGDINEIRMLLKGNVEICLQLFRQAVAEQDAVLQIQLSHALFGMEQGKDESKDFSSLRAPDLEKFVYYPRNYDLFNAAYNRAMELESEWGTNYSRGKRTFSVAADQGYLPAFLELKCREWTYTDSYGFACQLRRFVGQGDKRLDYYFGRALKGGSQIGSDSYYEGMYWMNRSSCKTVQYPSKHESFEACIRRLVRESEEMNYNHDGFCHIGSDTVLAPSKEEWDNFVREKLENVSIAPLDSYKFCYNSEEIQGLLRKYEISARKRTTYVDSAAEGGRGAIRSFIDFLSIFKNGKKAGVISFQRSPFEFQTFEDPEIQPVINFIQKVMARVGSAYSAFAWLEQIKKEDE